MEKNQKTIPGKSSNQARNLAIVFILLITLFVLLFLNGCSTSREAQKTGYLVTVETSGVTAVSHLYRAAAVDSVVASNFGFAITGFSSDSVFACSPYFIIETFGKTIYAEEKALNANGKLKMGKLKK